jgi:hypothetical protein
MRERLVVSPESLLTNDFWDCFRRDFRFQWPFPLREMYQVDPTSRRFQFSPLFERRHREISMWQMEERFFGSFPELSDDIKVVQHSSPELLTDMSFLGGSLQGLQGGDLDEVYHAGVDGVNTLNINDVFNMSDGEALWSA